MGFTDDRFICTMRGTQILSHVVTQYVRLSEDMDIMQSADS